jgi:hypothetical protein
MEHLPKDWIKRPKISIEHHHILTINKHILELPDITPATLFDYIKMGRPVIDGQLAILHELRRNSEHANITPSILVGRLALIGSEDRVLTRGGLSLMNADDICKDDLVKGYDNFWSKIEDARYQPRVYRQILANSPEYGGTWLGLRRP